MVDAVELDIDVVKTVVSVVLTCDITTDDDRFEDVITELVSPLVEAIFNYNEVTHMQARNFFFSSAFTLSWKHLTLTRTYSNNRILTMDDYLFIFP